MKLSYQWLRELVETDLPPRDLAARLTHVGLVVDAVLDLPDGDAQFDAEVTTNRPDWLGHWGVAREIAALTRQPVRLPPIHPRADGPDIRTLTSVTVEDDARDACPRYTARVIQGVTVGPSPDWLRRRLEAIGQRSINNIVDVTNLVQFEMNQPLHAFDLDWLDERRIVVRRARRGEPFAAITGEEGVLDGQLVIADARRAVALAGVKGGKNSEVQPQTRNILIEAAYFEPRQVRRASRVMKMASESSYRFERGVDPGAVSDAGARAAALILELAGGTLAQGVIDTGPDLAAPWTATLRFDQASRVLGVDFPPDAMIGALEGLGLAVVSRDAASATFRVPTYRGDLTREIDLVEEVARILGYDRIPDTIGLPLMLATESRRLSTQRTARTVLAGLGYFECFCDAFVPVDACADFTPAATPLGGGAPFTVRNPVNAQRAGLRTSLVPSLLEARAVNRLERDVRLFEINRVYFRGPDGQPEEREQLAVLDDQGPAAARGALEAVVDALKLSAPVGVAAADAADDVAGAQSGASATLGLGGTRGWALVGRVGEGEASRYGLRMAPGFAVADLGVLSEAERRVRLFTPLPRYPGIRRDIALVVEESVTWASVETMVRGFGDRGVEGVELESVYRGKGVEGGRKSMAFSFTCRREDRSLTDEEANGIRDEVVDTLLKNITGATTR